MKKHAKQSGRKKVLVVLMIASLGYICYQAVASVKPLSNFEKKEKVYDMYEGYRKSFPDVPDISPKRAMRLMKSGKAIFVDVRTPTERKVSMLPAAIPAEKILENPSSYRDKIIISYCTISYRSATFTRKLMHKGLTAYNLAGGMLAWVLEGGKVYDASGEVKRIHVYGERWNYPPAGYEAVW